ncbi:hypothetical protein [Stenotrophomonas sp.]|uniref:hypothetical protein n=1 Tax=Stenotrophomonas sp. TaxID=69392 RepID=UPI0028A86731|nr:hypothetical protein [Stenotrophomonas sp.]
MRGLCVGFFLFLLFLAFTAVQARSLTPDARVEFEVQSPTSLYGGSNARIADTASQAAKQEVALLRAQLQYSKDFQDSLLSTVYWALGGTFVLVGLLLGFGWFANFKVYERDKIAMKTELEALIIAKITDLNISSVVSEEVKLASARGEAATMASMTQISNALEAISEKVFRIELARLKLKMESNASDSMALTDALGVMELCVLRDPDELPDVMRFMLNKIEKGGKLTAGEITRVSKVLDRLPAHYGALSEKLRAKVIASDIF